MLQQVQVCRIRPSEKVDIVNVDSVLDVELDHPLANRPTNLVTAQIAGKCYLLMYEASSDVAAVYSVDDDAKQLHLAGKLKIRAGWDSVDHLVIGNQPHLMCYQKLKGIFHFFPVISPTEVAPPYEFYRNHDPGITKGFSVIKPFVAAGAAAFLGYCQEDGRVAIYTLSVTATSLDGVPPLNALNVWSHQWAKGWTRFAFFQFGGENFFLKTNIAKPNVNIDHILDGLSGGTIEVATKMALKDAQELDVVTPVILANGDPYFVTYRKSGAITVNRFHADCLGWTTVAELTGLVNATSLLSFRIDSATYILLC
ncbi:unnamed protein product [marine sediment metagenome]|uniref:Uncharacterized protein n=1 Tax=marine sediment metagenome TaxID=412755 RepID=X0RSE0_9ZZZZ